jgi:hypothetical protein
MDKVGDLKEGGEDEEDEIVLKRQAIVFSPVRLVTPARQPTPVACTRRHGSGRVQP